MVPSLSRPVTDTFKATPAVTTVILPHSQLNYFVTPGAQAGTADVRGLASCFLALMHEGIEGLGTYECGDFAVFPVNDSPFIFAF